MKFNAHEMTTIRYAIERVARDEVGPHVQMARLIRENMSPPIYPLGAWAPFPNCAKSQKALDTLIAHGYHGFKYGHFSGEFAMDNGTYKFTTSSGQECIEENHHQGNSYRAVPKVTFSFHPWPDHSHLTLEPQ